MSAQPCPASRWRNDRDWAARLREDETTLEARTTTPQRDGIQRVIASAGDGNLDFLVVYGSVSRGQQRADSDLDVYYETSQLEAEIAAADPDSRWHVFGAPSGALLASLRGGDRFAFDLTSDALVVRDSGRFRDLVVALDEEHLVGHST